MKIVSNKILANGKRRVVMDLDVDEDFIDTMPTIELVELAITALAKNNECYVAQWLLQNPDKKIDDYTLHTTDWFDYEAWHFTFELRRKECVQQSA